MKTKRRSTPPRRETPSPTSELASLIAAIAHGEGFLPTPLPGVRLMRSRETYPSSPVTYDPSIVIIAQGRKRGRLGAHTFDYNPRNYLVLSVPLPFECQTIGTLNTPLLGLSVRIDPTIVAELLLELDMPASGFGGSPRAVDSVPLGPVMLDAATRLARALQSPMDSRILGPQIMREITYRALCDRQGAALRALATPQSNLGQIARALRRIHLDYARPVDIPSLAREASMSTSTFHSRFKAVTSHSPLRYLQTIRLHKAQTLIVTGTPVAEAARRVGYESPSQFSREFKRLFSSTPREFASRPHSSTFAF